MLCVVCLATAHIRFRFSQEVIPSFRSEECTQDTEACDTLAPLRGTGYAPHHHSNHARSTNLGGPVCCRLFVRSSTHETGTFTSCTHRSSKSLSCVHTGRFHGMASRLSMSGLSICLLLSQVVSRTLLLASSTPFSPSSLRCRLSHLELATAIPVYSW